MMNNQHIRISKFLSLVLRHKPAAIGITLDESGWTDVGLLIEKSRSAHVELTIDLLKEIVLTNSKQRFSFNATFDKIRASQGHSVDVDLGYKAESPPEILYHGTSSKVVASIEQSGIKKGARHHVHLSVDRETAFKVGLRHGKPVVFKVMAGQMFRDHFTFYLSDNGVWLTDHVPPDHLERDTE